MLIRRIHILFLLLLALPLSFAYGDTQELESQKPDSISFITWNIEWFPGRFRYARGERVATHMEQVQDELRRMNPDIFLAQEIRSWQAFAELCTVIPDLQPTAVSAFRSRSTGEYWPQQIAIASKWPVYAAWSEPWQQGDDVDPGRGFTVAAVQLPGKTFRLLLVYSVHLKSNIADTEYQSQINYEIRNESIRQLLDHIRHMEETAFWGRVVGVVVGGDFNTNQDGEFGDRVVELMTEAGFYHTWEGVPRNERLTWRGKGDLNPVTFDHFFTRDLGAPQAEMLEVSNETSDHWPVKIVIPLSSLL